MDTKELQQMGFMNEKGEITETAKKNFKSVPEGASTQCWAATAPEIEG